MLCANRKQLKFMFWCFVLFTSGRQCLLLKDICYSAAIPKVNNRVDDDHSHLMLETAVCKSLN